MPDLLPLVLLGVMFTGALVALVVISWRHDLRAGGGTQMRASVVADATASASAGDAVASEEPAVQLTTMTETATSPAPDHPAILADDGRTASNVIGTYAGEEVATIRFSPGDYQSRRHEREAWLISTFWLTSGAIAAAVLAFTSAPSAVRVISWIVLGIASFVALLLLCGFLWQLWEHVVRSSPRTAAAVYLCLSVLGLAAAIALIPPIINIAVVIFLGIAIAKLVHVLWVDPVPPWLIGGFIGAVISFCLVGVNPPLFRLIVWYHNHWQEENYRSCLANSVENDFDPTQCVYEWTSIRLHRGG